MRKEILPTHIVGSRQVRQLPNLPNLPNLPSYLKIINVCYNKELPIKEIAEVTKKDFDNVFKLISRKDQDNLLDKGLLEISRIEGKTKFYTATNSGKAEIDILLQEEKRKQDRLKEEREQEEVVNNSINTFKDFFDKYYYPQLLEINRKGINYIEIDFTELIKFNTFLSDQVLELPEELLKAAELAIKEFDFPKKITNFNVRFKNLPSSCKVNIAEIRSLNINKFIVIEGVPIGCTSVRPRVTAAKFECPSCGNIIKILQLDEQYKGPSGCGCGRKSKFKEISRKLEDCQGLVVEEPIEGIGRRTNPQQLTVFLEGDLTDIGLQPALEESQPIKINGWVQEIPIINKRGKQSTKRELIFMANSIEINPRTFEEKLTQKEVQELEKELVKPNFKEIFINSFCPTIVGLNKIKIAILLAAVSGGSGTLECRDDSHLLIVGDPGTAKSKLLEGLSDVITCRWASGNETTSAGLIGTVVRDEMLGQNVLSKGVLAMANNSVVLMDELDKLKSKDVNALHEPLENQKVTINKWNKHAQFKTDITFIAAANPKHGRFIRDSPGNLIEQVELPAAIFNRFDLILPLFDIPGKRDIDIVASVLNKYENKIDYNKFFSEKFITNFLQYARNLKPTLNKKTEQKITQYYINKREGSKASIQINPRTLEGLIRLTKAAAKLRLSEVAEVEDFELVVQLFDLYFDTFLYNNITKSYDVDISEPGLNSEERLICRLIGNDLTNLTDLHSKLNIDENKFEEIISKMKSEGAIFEPKAGFIKIL